MHSFSFYLCCLHMWKTAQHCVLPFFHTVSVSYLLKKFSWPHCTGMQNLQSLIRDQTHASCIESMESYPLYCQGSPPQTLSILTEDTSVVTWEQGGTGRNTRKTLGGGKYDHYCDDSFLRAYLYQYLSSCIL